MMKQTDVHKQNNRPVTTSKHGLEIIDSVSNRHKSI